MSRHRRQASQVLPPEILTGDGPLGDSLVRAKAGVTIVGHSSEGSSGGGVTTVNERPTNPTTITHPQEQSTAAHFQDKKSLPAKRA
ncbi:hypothetical protein P3X46_028826 [Hevea brasiliensis]|uniref:SMP domain-containing protein n=1 Tax=Hevea brasiliensis TaxID=3981 RepID=A0ABQ9KTP5_HEVBR|nr:hypothetical protein P3X46_028826 [Hevea brasiliensis]